jgi:RNA polymerase sigma-70 factor (ECF subfamily)
LVLRYQDRVFNLILHQCGSALEAEDLTQEAFLKAFRGLAAFRHGSHFYTWLFRIAINTVLSRGRKLARRKVQEGVRLEGIGEGGEKEEAGDGHAIERAGPEGEDPRVVLEKKDLQEQVWKGLGVIRPEYKAVLLLRDMEGQDYQTIAETLGLSQAAVKSRLHRARMELAKVLKDLRPEGMGK